MKGGSGRIIPIYKDPVNSPFVSNSQKETNIIRTKETKQYEQTQQTQQPKQYEQTQQPQQPQQQKLDPLVNLQVYQQNVKPKETKSIGTFNMPIVPTPYFPPQYGFPPYMYTQPYYPHIAPGQIIKKYNINIDGVTGDHSKLNLIYEDVLPQKEFVGTFGTVGERNDIFDYIRAMLFEHGDGRNTGLDGKSEDSLLSHLKFMNLNPYNTYKFSNNPYKNLPFGFLIFQGCYPIRYDHESASVICAKNSIGTNVRIYRMTQGSHAVNNQSVKKINEYDEWREISYYEYVREHIIKKKECPNFVVLFGYYISENSMIDFDKIAEHSAMKNENYTYNSLLPKIAEPKYKYATNDEIAQPQFILQGGTGKKINNNNNNNNNNAIVSVNKSCKGYNVNIALDHNAYIGKALVAITEAPTYNLFGWASKSYYVEGNIKRQVAGGHYSDKVWFSVLFQIMAGLYTMQKHQIYYECFDPESHIYIKDLSVQGMPTKYWKYRVNGIEYYIPNYGYLVLIDSNFKDVKPQQFTFNRNNNDIKYKIYTKFLDKTIKDADFESKSFDAFKNTFDTNVFSQSYVNFGGRKPPSNVLKLLNDIQANINTSGTKNIGEYMYQHMRFFMNNRIGTYLRELETWYIRKNDNKQFAKGQLVVYEDSSSSYKFVMYITQTGSEVTVLSKNDPENADITEMKIQVTSLYAYSKSEHIAQFYKQNDGLLNDDELMETYVIA